MSNELTGQQDLRDIVLAGYGKIAETGAWGADATAPNASGGGCCGMSSCCGPAGASADDLAQRIGYDAGELAALPVGANLGLSCGNPTAIAALRPGEVVLDLGSGGGFDCFIAGSRVGPAGRVIGVDMTPAMIGRARRNLASYRERSGLDNVEFRLGEIEHLPLADASVDVVISNCVLNLSPDKQQSWREVARVLRPGGRVAVSDLALLRPLPASVSALAQALVGCIAGAAPVNDTRVMMAHAGLVDIVLTPKPIYVQSLNDLQDPLYRQISQHLPEGLHLSDFITSLDVAARKP